MMRRGTIARGGEGAVCPLALPRGYFTDEEGAGGAA